MKQQFLILLLVALLAFGAMALYRNQQEIIRDLDSRLRAEEQEQNVNVYPTTYIRARPYYYGGYYKKQHHHHDDDE